MTKMTKKFSFLIAYYRKLKAILFFSFRFDKNCKIFNLFSSFEFDKNFFNFQINISHDHTYFGHQNICLCPEGLFSPFSTPKSIYFHDDHTDFVPQIPFLGSEALVSSFDPQNYTFSWLYLFVGLKMSICWTKLYFVGLNCNLSD
jgi:hypothetical protein